VAKMMIYQGAAMVLTNEPETMGSARGKYVLVTRDGEYPLNGSKDEIAAAIWNQVLRPGFLPG